MSQNNLRIYTHIVRKSTFQSYYMKGICKTSVSVNTSPLRWIGGKTSPLSQGMHSCQRHHLIQ